MVARHVVRPTTSSLWPRLSPALSLVVLALCTGCGNSVATDQAFADNLVRRELQPPLTFEEVRTVLARHDANPVLQKGCSLVKDTQADCAYSSVTLIPLPRNHWWRGQGDLQISMIFDAQEQLLSVDYELTYPGDR